MAVTRKQVRGIQGVTSLRKKLRRMHQETENTIRPVLEAVANDILLDMRGLTPVDTGNVVDEMRFTISADGLTARIGLTTKVSARDAFYFAFLDSGTKGAPEQNIPPLPALHIRDRALDGNRASALDLLKREINATLKRVAHGGG